MCLRNGIHYDLRVCTELQVLSKTVSCFCLSMGTKILEVDLLKKKQTLNLGHYFLTRRGRDFICIFLVTRPFHGYHNFYALGSNDRGHIVFVLSVLSVCLTVVNFNICYNFWTVRGRDFIFGMHTPLMMPFQMTPRSMTLWPWLWPLLKNGFFGLCCRGGHSQCFTNTPWFLTLTFKFDLLKKNLNLAITS